MMSCIVIVRIVHNSPQRMIEWIPTTVEFEKGKSRLGIHHDEDDVRKELLFSTTLDDLLLLLWRVKDGICCDRDLRLSFSVTFFFVLESENRYPSRPPTIEII